MDTSEAAAFIGTTPRILRQFLRSGFSPFVPVGSGSRYEFKQTEMQTLSTRFSDWKGAGKPRPETAAKKATTSAGNRSSSKSAKQAARDRQEWAEEGPVVLEDIRNPRVRARVLARAQAAEDELMLRLMAAGLHISQLGDRKSA